MVAVRDDIEGHCSAFITSLLREYAGQKARRPRKYEGLWLSLVR